mgnify:CR=1 FL=1
MTKRPHEPAGEALSNVGLFLNVAAILAFAIGLAGLGSHASLLAAGTVGFSALLFLASLVCFAVGGRRRDARRTRRGADLKCAA